jgi:hypothetical protein
VLDGTAKGGEAFMRRTVLLLVAVFFVSAALGTAPAFADPNPDPNGSTRVCNNRCGEVDLSQDNDTTIDNSQDNDTTIDNSQDNDVTNNTTNNIDNSQDNDTDIDNNTTNNTTNNVENCTNSISGNNNEVNC